MSLVSTDKYCTFSYWYDRYGYRHVEKSCTTTEEYSGILWNSYEKYYDSYSDIDEYSDLYSTDEYCTWSYDFYEDIERCSTTTTYLNGDVEYSTDIYYFPSI